LFPDTVTPVALEPVSVTEVKSPFPVIVIAPATSAETVTVSKLLALVNETKPTFPATVAEIKLSLDVEMSGPD